MGNIDSFGKSKGRKKHVIWRTVHKETTETYYGWLCFRRNREVAVPRKMPLIYACYLPRNSLTIPFPSNHPVVEQIYGEDCGGLEPFSPGLSYIISRKVLFPATPVRHRIGEGSPYN
jgi:hypothetical protein